MSHKKVERIDPLTQALPCVGCDSHAHLDGEEFDADREEVLARARAAGVATIGPCIATHVGDGAVGILCYPSALHSPLLDGFQMFLDAPSSKPASA